MKIPNPFKHLKTLRLKVKERWKRLTRWCKASSLGIFLAKQFDTIRINVASWRRKQSEKLEKESAMKKFVYSWLVTIVIMVLVGLAMAVSGLPWFVLNIGLGQMVFVLLFWVFAWELKDRRDPKNRSFSTAVPLGKFAIVMKGGQIDRVLMNVKGLTTRNTVNDPFEVVPGEEQMGFFDSLASVIGLRLIGIIPIWRLFGKKSQWNEQGKENPKDVKSSFIPRSEEIYFFSYQRNYGILIPAGETGKGLDEAMGGKPTASMLHVDLYLLVTPTIRYIYRAFVLNDWLTVLQAKVEEISVGYLGGRSVMDVVKQKPEDLNGIADAIVAASKKLLVDTGVSVEKCSYKGLEFSGEDGEKIRTAIAERVATEQKAAGRMKDNEADIDLLTKKVAQLSLLHPSVAAATELSHGNIRTLAIGNGGMILASDPGQTETKPAVSSTGGAS